MVIHRQFNRRTKLVRTSVRQPRLGYLLHAAGLWKRSSDGQSSRQPFASRRFVPLVGVNRLLGGHFSWPNAGVGNSWSWENKPHQTLEKKKTCPDAPKVEVKRNSKNIYMLHCWKNYIFNLNKKGVNTRYLVYVSSLKKDSFKITKIILIISRRPRWLSRLSSCLLKSIERVQFSPSAHTRRDFFLHKKMISGKSESVS